jgi:hypothetical protein
MVSAVPRGNGTASVIRIWTGGKGVSMKLSDVDARIPSASVSKAN